MSEPQCDGPVDLADDLRMVADRDRRLLERLATEDGGQG